MRYINLLLTLTLIAVVSYQLFIAWLAMARGAAARADTTFVLEL